VRIAINTRFLIADKMEGFGWYTYEITRRIVKDHPEHEFFFFFDRPYHPDFIFASNVTPVVLCPAARHPILFVWWFEVMVKRALRKHRIDLFFSPDGYLSLGSTIPQLATIHDINFEHHPKDIPLVARIYLKFFFPLFAQKARHLLTVSEYSKSDICKTYRIPESKVTAILNGVSDHYRPLSKEYIVALREKYTGGHPYFIFVGAIHPRKNVKRLLEAFLKFKKSHTSPFKMVVVGEYMWRKDPDLERLSCHLGRELIFTGHVQQAELTQLVGAAYALTYVPYYEGFGIPVVEAMKCGVPVIVANRTSLPEVAGESALWCDPFDVESISEAMIRLTSDHDLYNRLSSSCLQRSKLFSWDKAARQVWREIEQLFDGKSIVPDGRSDGQINGNKAK
jgi:glycosyltransferase involved in cell wall biosynthesis